MPSTCRGWTLIRRYLKKVFSLDIGVESSSQVLEILEYACGLRPTRKNRSGGKSRKAGILGPALISNENPNFEIASSALYETVDAY